MIPSLRYSDLQKRYGKIFSALLATFVLFYLVAHALSGERGLYVLLKEQRRLEVVQAELVDASAKRKSLEHKVQMLSSGSLDLDLLDEQSRRYLSEAGEGEIMIPLAVPKK
jgi:cell division protein FtsB